MPQSAVKLAPRVADTNGMSVAATRLVIRIEQADGSRLLDCPTAKRAMSRQWGGSSVNLKRYPPLPVSMRAVGIDDYRPWRCAVHAGLDSFDERAARRGMFDWFANGLSAHADCELHEALVGKVVRLYSVAPNASHMIDDALFERQTANSPFTSCVRSWEYPTPADQVVFLAAEAREVAACEVPPVSYERGADTTAWIETVVADLARQLDELSLAA
jgi:hypothetical protein